MFSKLRGRVSSAHVIALAALFVALGGTAFAAATVGTNDIKNGAVTKKKLHKKAVTTRKIKRQAVKTGKVKDLAVKTDKLDDLAVTTDKLSEQAVTTGKIADQAVTTDKIADQAVSTNKIADQAVTTGKLGGDSVTAPKLAGTTDGVTTVNVPANSTLNVTATCPAGGQAITGGYFTPTSGVVQVTRMRRDTDSTWVFTFRNNAGTAQAVDARVTCLLG